jgi:GNAT superfamily N-acetyltransferase
MHHQIELIDLNDHEQLRACFTVFTFLRPHLSETQFIHAVQIQAEEGFQIAVIKHNDEVLAATGFRFQHFLYAGKVLYVDDLITHPAKKKSGLASTLIAWLNEKAKTEDCSELHLDSGYQRNDAHRLYLKSGFDLTSHHFSKKVT